MEDFLQNAGLVTARFSAFIAHTLIFGVVPVVLLLAREAIKRQPDGADIRDGLDARMSAIVGWALVASLFSTLGFVILKGIEVGEIQGEFGWSSISSVFEAPYGKWYFARFPVLLILAVFLIMLRRRGTGIVDMSNGALSAWGALGAFLLATSSLSGHASVTSPQGVGITSDVLHLVSGATWFAGIVFLRATLPASWHGLSEEDRLIILTPVVHRFSRLALVSIAVVAGTGLINSLLNVGSLSGLTDTGYGRVLIAKLLAFVAIVALGAINHFMLRPRLERVLASGKPDQTRHVLGRTVAIEVFLAVVILALSAALVDIGRPVDAL